MQLSKLSIIFFALLSVSQTWSKSINQKTIYGIEYPDYAMLVNDKEHGRIQAHCKEIEDKSGNITCTFEQVIVQHKNMEDSLDELNKANDKNNKEVESELNNIRHDIKRNQNIDKTMSDKYKTAKTDEEKKFIVDLKTLTMNPTRENLVRLMEDRVQLDKLTCTIFSRTYTDEFQYNFYAKQWVHQGSPNSLFNGPCGVINISHLEKDSRKDYSDWAWNYTSRDIVTNKSGKILGKYCSELAQGKNNIENEVTYYSAFAGRVEPTQLMNCKYINFSD